ncbi:MFS transporter [Corynebacterium sp. zg254]|uniref:MFS transporter n=1 Tax=Corynebacterium zhongnanshanii TaxID=2768834 RepID=A0ABQ6VE49_9CORY|nr:MULTISPECIES: MFS transporter [Corynebacterium]KAB3522664.1 MFS transporter [Corynebacterium zhongnanshanii]MCR5914288.1 MFS transporter [Corynebacterium sp. zg254]
MTQHHEQSDNSSRNNTAAAHDTPQNASQHTTTAKQQRRPKNYWILVAFAVFIVAWGGNEFTPMMVFYRQEHVFGAVFVESLLACYAAGIAVSLLLSGPLSDRFGRKIVMLPAPLIALVASLLIAVGEVNEPLIFTGRVLSGIAIGSAMTAGGSWIKELSNPRLDPSARPNSGAKRATMSLTGGFALGAALAGSLAEWGPAPGQTTYVIHAILAAVAMFGLLSVPETRQSAHLKVKGSLWSDLLVPTARHPRFLLVVLPIAPWVFGSAGVAYAIMPSLAQKGVEYPIAFSALVTALSLATGFIVQQFVHLYTSPRDARGPQLGLVLAFIGMALAAYVSENVTSWGVLAVAVLLGLAYGICLISGLGEVQRLAGPDDLGGLTAIFYTVTYIGFFFPMILRRLNDWFTYPMMLGFGAVMAALFFVVVTANSKKFLPENPQDSQ